MAANNLSCALSFLLILLFFYFSLTLSLSVIPEEVYFGFINSFTFHFTFTIIVHCWLYRQRAALSISLAQS